MPVHPLPDHPLPVHPLPDQPVDSFADRHIGPGSDAVTTMLGVIGVSSLEELAMKAVPTDIIDSLGADGVAPGLDTLPPAASEQEALAELWELAASNTVAVSMIGQGYYDTPHPAGFDTKSAREPGLVHGLHPLPARNQPGPARGVAELPDHDFRSDRHGCCQRLDARRGHRRRRGDNIDAPGGTRFGQSARRRL